MNKNKIKNTLRLRRKSRVRAKISGTADRPRLSVFRSLKHISVQLIDDQAGKTLVSVKDTEITGASQKTERAKALGALLAKKAATKKISQAVFDKGAYRFHGRVQAVADGARESGLKI